MSAAVLSSCGTYRYALWRDVAQPQLTLEQEVDLPLNRWTAEDTVLFVMLNPSTADATVDDRTIGRCLGFARRWGFGRLAVANLYAYRSTDPDELWTVEDPVGPENDDWICTLANDADVIVAAWGVHAKPARVDEVTPMLAHDQGVSCLRKTIEGHPGHPLYVPGDVELVGYA